MAKITNKEFIHWCNHTDYSSFDGVSDVADECYILRLIKKLFKRCWKSKI